MRMENSFLLMLQGKYKVSGDDHPLLANSKNISLDQKIHAFC
jgi:hypothetical protein